jgi:hypothetical protein
MRWEARRRPSMYPRDHLYLIRLAAAEGLPPSSSWPLQPSTRLSTARSADAAVDATLRDERMPIGCQSRVLDVHQVALPPREYFSHLCSKHLHDLQQQGSQTERTSMYQAKNAMWPVFAIACRHDRLESTLLPQEHEGDQPMDHPLVWSLSIRLVRSRPHRSA